MIIESSQTPAIPPTNVSVRAALLAQLRFSVLVAVVVVIFSASLIVLARNTDLDMGPTGHIAGILGALLSALCVNFAARSSYTYGSLSFPALALLVHMFTLCSLVLCVQIEYRFADLFYYATCEPHVYVVLAISLVATGVTSICLKRRLTSWLDLLLCIFYSSLYLGAAFALYPRLPRF